MNTTTFIVCVFIALCWFAWTHKLMFLAFLTSNVGRLCLVAYILAATYENQILGLFIAVAFITANVLFVIKPTPNIITANSSTFIESNFIDKTRALTDNKIKYENYVFLKPFGFPNVQRTPSTNRILPFGA